MDNIIILHDLKEQEVTINPSSIIYYREEGSYTVIALRDRYFIEVLESPRDITDILRSSGVGVYRKQKLPSSPF